MKKISMISFRQPIKVGIFRLFLNVNEFSSSNNNVHNAEIELKQISKLYI